MSALRNEKMSERKPINFEYVLFGVVLSICVLIHSYSYYLEATIKIEQSKTIEQKQAEKQAKFKQDSINNVCDMAKEKCEWCEKHNRQFTDADIGIFVLLMVIILLVCGLMWAFRP